ncbi:MAG TPA: 30S ribosomal protein S2 [Blastocatellia bacterium]|nr:30S ribosomal protein S2 [Blastocatellia bacterium]
MATVTMKELLEAGVHFGHQVRRWNPKMKEYIFGERNGIYIIDLQKTQRMFKEAIKFITNMSGEGTSKTILFVGTKRQAQDAIKEEALRCNQFYVNQRWLGGLLTNFQTIQKSIKRYKEIEAMQADGRIEAYAKKERLQIERERQALEKNLSGIKEMKKLPDVIFVIDTNKEEIAVKEANRLGIPVVAVVDTNCSPEGVNHVIPGNDDALRAVRLFASRIADAILEGRQLAEQKEAEDAAAAAEQAKATGVTIEITPRQQRDRGGQPQRGERRERGGRGRGDRGRGGDRRPKKTAPGTVPPAISGVRPSSVEAVETVEAVIHPVEGAEAAEAAKVAKTTETPELAPPTVETPAPEAEKAPVQDASAA